MFKRYDGQGATPFEHSASLPGCFVIHIERHKVRELFPQRNKRLRGSQRVLGALAPSNANLADDNAPNSNDWTLSILCDYRRLEHPLGFHNKMRGRWRNNFHALTDCFFLNFQEGSSSHGLSSSNGSRFFWSASTTFSSSSPVSSRLIGLLATPFFKY